MKDPLDMMNLLNRKPIVLGERWPQGARVLVTGCAGSIGSCIVARGRYEQAAIYGIDRSEFGLHALGLASDPRFRLCDVTDADRVMDLFHRVGPTHVIHTAAYKHVPIMESEVMEAVRNNCQGTANVVRACLSVGARLVLISTDKAVDPVCVMGMTKALAERHVRAEMPDHSAILRFGNVIGSSGSVIETWLGQRAAGEPLTVTDPDMTRWFITTEEAVSFAVWGMGRTGTYALDMGQPVRIGDMAARLANGEGVRVVGGRKGERQHERLVGEGERAEQVDGVPVVEVVNA